MKKPDSPQLEALESLLAEKRKHEGYLAKLEERRAGTPEHVFSRLRDEYLTKLMDAQVRAHAEAEALESGLEVDQAAVADVEARLAALEEERVEGELREAVGELDSKEWQKRLIALTAGISMATKEREALTSSAQRVRSLLAEARGEPAMQAGPPPIQEPVSAKPAPRNSAAAPISNAPNFDELAFLNSVVGRTSSPTIPIALTPALAPRPANLAEPASAQPGARLTPAPPPPVVPPAPRVSVPVAPIKESPSVKEPTSAPKPEAASAPKPADSAAPQLALGTTAAPAFSEPVSAPVPVAPIVPAAAPVPTLGVPDPEPLLRAPTPAEPTPAEPEPADPEDEEPPSALGRPTARNTQVVKTLKCGECGSMNYPTEWYCERCGGELAAL
jgi:hypothetical protein